MNDYSDLSPAEILQKIRNERDQRSYYKDSGVKIDPLAIYKSSTQDSTDTDSGVPKVDPINFLRNIAGQVVRNRTEDAGLVVPEDIAESVPPRQVPVVETPVETAPETTSESTPAPYTEGKWGSQWGEGSYSTEELRKRFALDYSKDLEEKARARKGTGMYNEAGDIWGKSSTGEDVYLGKAQGLYGNEELISGHARQADPREVIHKEKNEQLSSIGDRAGAIWNLWKRD